MFFTHRQFKRNRKQLANQTQTNFDLYIKRQNKHDNFYQTSNCKRRLFVLCMLCVPICFSTKLIFFYNSLLLARNTIQQKTIPNMPNVPLYCIYTINSNNNKSANRIKQCLTCQAKYSNTKLINIETLSLKAMSNSI